ncbi:hypothetical protein NW752_008168 [Fusarium irregulare]|uniref:Uncharacterized protein n=1 Tax=Fusarium irregulare TaxID=2494466 RepID=A0A9W8UDT4_9HYPO|nr:hypothetical protein NW752_008168 [Fusarium irregulare]KAJ4019576.1 hypothetical protein NW766_003312 [Fusarium irregulare]
MEPLTRGREVTLPVIRPSRPASAPPVMFEKDKTEESWGSKQYYQVRIAGHLLTKCVTRRPERPPTILPEVPTRIL